MKRIGWIAAALALTLAPRARAEARLGLGVDYLLSDRAAFRIDLQGDLPLLVGAGRNPSLRIAATGRAGGLVTASPAVGAAPLDLGIRVGVGRAYVEALAGPWIFFSGDAVRGHGALGFGFGSRGVSVGLEIGALTGTSGLVGGRLAFHL
ncbi:MAG: hypothetical protein NVS2B9_08120 [Myxococcales bacterium]